MIPKKFQLAFRETLYTGGYNLLVGAGISLDSTNGNGDKLLGTEALRRELCQLAGAPESTSLTRVYGLLTEEQIQSHIVRPYSNCNPGPSLKHLPKYLWRRIFSFNIDNVIESLYASTSERKQKVASVNFDNPFEPTPDRDELQTIHLHGSTLKSGAGFVFSLSEYARVMRGLNPWMHLMAEILATEPFVIAGTSLTEPDLEYYLSFRTSSTPKRGLGPSLLIDPNHNVVTRSDCERHGLIAVEGAMGEFLNWLSSEFSSPPSITNLIVPEISSIVDDGLDGRTALRFFSDFEQVTAVDRDLSPTPSAFYYGRGPTWSDIQHHADIDRSEITPIIGLTTKVLTDKHWSGDRLIAIMDDAGSGKSTVLKRVGHELAKSGWVVLSLRSFGRLDDEAAIECLSKAKSRVVLLVDGLADHVEQILTILEHPEASSNVVVLTAERKYRQQHVDAILGPLPRLASKLAPFSKVELSQLIERYRRLGLTGDTLAHKHPKQYVYKLLEDPITVAVCRILNDFRPLDSIVESLWKASRTEALFPFVCVALSQYCYRAGLRFSLLQRVLGATVSAGAIVDAEVPLKLVHSPVDSRFVVTMNAALGERTLLRSVRVAPHTLYEAFVAVAQALAPRVNRKAVMRRTPEARLAGRLFDYDTVVKQFLGERSEAFYLRMQDIWGWNSRYWEQRALMSAETNLDLGLQYARNAVGIEFHPFPLTTLGKLLFRRMEEEPARRDADFEEAFDRLCAAIEIELRRARSTPHPFQTLMYGVARYLELGGTVTNQQLEQTLIHQAQAKEKFGHESHIVEAIDRLDLALHSS